LCRVGRRRTGRRRSTSYRISDEGPIIRTGRPIGGRRLKSTRTGTEKHGYWIGYTKNLLDTVITLHPVSSQLKTILPAYYAADALWKYYKAYEKGGPGVVVQTYEKGRAVEALADLQTEATWNLIGADKFVPAPYKEPAKMVLGKVMTKISEKEVDFIEEYLERRASS
jgi:hypothetical protein